jgi:hypothetical protein
MKRLFLFFWCMAMVLPCKSADMKLNIAPTAKWAFYTDEVAGGKSTVKVAHIKDVREGVKLDGELTNKFVYPFAGAQAYFKEDRAAEDATKYTGVQFWVKGDGRTYGVQVVTSGIKDYNYFAKPFKTSENWTLVQVPFKDMVQMIPWAKKVEWTGSDVQGVGFQASGFLGTFWVEVSDICLYK